ncbi:MAG: hypothetical protein HGB05_20135, partial [Chloroflexi bacterium]|nr:hypothetical protein [Chloroflexota bacterium]
MERFNSGHTGPVTSVALSPDSKSLFSAGADSNLIVWDLTGRQSITSIVRPQSSRINSVAFNS